MFVLQDKKLYVETEKGLVGVDIISPSKISRIDMKPIKYDNGKMLTRDEVMAKFGILNGKTYEFPNDKKEELQQIKEELTDDVSIKPTTKSTKKPPKSKKQ